MSFFNPFGKASRPLTQGLISYGTLKNDGSHDHRTNKGADRTPAQKSGDRKRNQRD